MPFMWWTAPAAHAASGVVRAAAPAVAQAVVMAAPEGGETFHFDRELAPGSGIYTSASPAAPIAFHDGDLIDFSRLGLIGGGVDRFALDFIGQAAFSHHPFPTEPWIGLNGDREATPELRYEFRWEGGGWNTHLLIDGPVSWYGKQGWSPADGIADLDVTVLGVHHFAASDFAL